MKVNGAYPKHVAVVYCGPHCNNRPQRRISEAKEVAPPGPRRYSPHASNRPTDPRSGGPQPLGRSDQLGVMPGDAPVASTPPRRGEPGR